MAHFTHNAMESKKDLAKICHEGFALIDEYYGTQYRKNCASPNPPTPKAFLYQYQPEKPYVYQVNHVSKTEKVVIQNHEAKNTDVLDIGLEGFALLDKYYGKKPGPSSSFAPRKPSVSPRTVAIQGPTKQIRNYHSQRPGKPNIYQVKPTYATEEKVMNAYDAAKLYGGVLVIDRPN